jgi:hypothetical protein
MGLSARAVERHGVLRASADCRRAAFERIIATVRDL